MAEMIKVECCKDCTKREIGCHGSCEEYQTTREKIAKERAEIYTKRNREREVDEVRFGGMNRIKRKRR